MNKINFEIKNIIICPSISQNSIKKIKVILKDNRSYIFTYKDSKNRTTEILNEEINQSNSDIRQRINNLITFYQKASHQTSDKLKIVQRNDGKSRFIKNGKRASISLDNKTIKNTYIKSECEIYSHNLKMITQNSHRHPESFKIVNKNVNGKPTQLIERNNFIADTISTLKNIIPRNSKKYKELLKTIIDSNIKDLKNVDREVYVNKKENVYNELFIVAQQYNHACNMHLDVNQSYKKEVKLFDDLELNTFINSSNCRDLAPLNIRSVNAAQRILEIPQNPDYDPLIIERGKLKKHKAYFYNAEDAKINHGAEARNIFSSTQSERFKSFIGHIIESIGKKFGKDITYFKKFHYFKNDEDKMQDIYSNDFPISASNRPTSYWVGHATCLFSIPLKNKDGSNIKINILSDPVEGDLNKILYPRMTRPARAVETLPTPHIYILSHNHLDHFDSTTLKKLKQQQPIMLVPQGDRQKFLNLGFTSANIYEHNWWQKTTIEIEQNGQKSEIQITAVPAHHWSGQGPCDGHHAAFLGYIIHQDEGDIYFAGDTARLTEKHIQVLRENFNIRSMFQPGGPDEVRKDMQSTHQSSVDGLWMHFNLPLRALYDKNRFNIKLKNEFLEEAKKLRTLYMHTKAYKLGNLHFDDTDVSINRVKTALSLRAGNLEEFLKTMKSYEQEVYKELILMGKNFKFKDGSHLTENDILEILNASVILPKIGSRTELAQSMSNIR